VLVAPEPQVVGALGAALHASQDRPEVPLTLEDKLNHSC